MPLTLPDYALILNYSIANGCNSAALCKFGHLKNICKDPLSLSGVRLMIKNFGESRSFHVKVERGRKPVSLQVIQENCYCYRYHEPIHNDITR